VTTWILVIQTVVHCLLFVHVGCVSVCAVYQIDRFEMEYILKRSGSDGTGDKSDLEGSDTVVRLRGLPFTCTKEEIATFFLGK